MIEYTPCMECLNRYGRQYSKQCDDICDYAKVTKFKDELETKLAYTNEMLSKAYQIIGEVVER